MTAHSSAATGMISTWFVEDLLLQREDTTITHIVQAIGSSSVDKGTKFASEVCPTSKATIYGSYKEVYEDPNVDIVYIGTPHGFHKRDCLEAIAAGKPILCEKAFTLNGREAREVFDAAKEKGVYVAEAMWLRHRPLVKDVQRLLHEEKVIGNIQRAFCDFGDKQDLVNHPESSRHVNPVLGPGSLLDLGIYCLTWITLALDPSTPTKSESPSVLATQTHWKHVETSTSAILRYASTGRVGMLTSTHNANGFPDLIARIQGSEGYIEVHGPCPSEPNGFTIYTNYSGAPGARERHREEIKSYKYPVEGRGYQYEADSAAQDVLAGRLESSVMPWAETIRMMELMDEIRRQGGTVFPADQVTQ